MSNARSSAASKEDFAVNTVGMVDRDGNDGTALRTITYVIQNNAESTTYVDAQQCDFVAYGYEPTESSGTVPTAVKDASYDADG